jgi:hypothetical protein
MSVVTRRHARRVLPLAVTCVGASLVGLALWSMLRECASLPSDLQLWRLNSQEGWILVRNRPGSPLPETLVADVSHVGCSRDLVIVRTPAESYVIRRHGAPAERISQYDAENIITERGLSMARAGVMARGIRSFWNVAAIVGGLSSCVFGMWLFGSMRGKSQS